MLNDIKNLNEHKKIAINQRNSYNFAKLNLAEGSILIELDWKQKLLIGIINICQILSFKLILIKTNRHRS